MIDLIVGLATLRILVLGLGFVETPITADKMEIKDFPKLISATSFIREPLSEISFIPKC